jgi:hypothetical protein
MESRRYLMDRRYLLPVAATCAALALVLLTTASMSGQSAAPAAKAPAAKAPAAKTAAKASALRTPWGDPDIQGTWFVMYDVPLERSAANAGKEFLTDAEIAEADARKGVNPGRNARSADKAQDVSGAYNAVFNSILKTGRRTSMIIDPPDGRIPPLVPGARAPQGGPLQGVPAGAGGAPRTGPAALGIAPGQNDNPETVAQSPRCLGVPMPFLPLNTAFAQGTVMQVVQSPKSVGIYMEDDHAGGGNRVIRLDKSPHPPASLRFYLGDSRGHWEGTTLVVETTNFEQGFRGANPDTYKMTERIMRMDANNLRREITFEDPKTWTRPWTVQIDMGKTEDHRHMIFDSACHEGNYGLVGILSGARREEQAAKQ